jgi:hypothetical protein
VNGNPISFFDGQEYRSLQADYIAAGDGTILYYIQPPSVDLDDLVGELAYRGEEVGCRPGGVCRLGARDPKGVLVVALRQRGVRGET